MKKEDRAKVNKEFQGDKGWVNGTITKVHKDDGGLRYSMMGDDNIEYDAYEEWFKGI